jgi:hypothetical protein
VRAFDLLAWKFLWAAGLWIGAGRPESIFKVLTSKTSAILAELVAAAFFSLRHPILHVQFDGELWFGLINKWHLGALRLLDVLSIAILFAVSRPWLARWLYDLSASFARQSIAGGVLCASAVLFRCAFFCKARNRIAH